MRFEILVYGVFACEFREEIVWLTGNGGKDEVTASKGSAIVFGVLSFVTS